MPQKKHPHRPFTSFRILGKKAQDLLKRARPTPERERKTAHAVMPLHSEPTDLTIGVSASHVAKATLVVIAILVGAWMLYALSDKIILLLLAFFVAAIMDPGVVLFEKWGIPRGFGILLHYFIALFLFVFLLVSLIPIIADQLQQIANLLSVYVDTYLRDPTIDLPFLQPQINEQLTRLAQSTLENLSIDQFTDALRTLGQNMASFAEGSFRLATRVAGSIVSFFVRLVVVLVLAFFIQMEKEHIRAWFRGFFPLKYRRYLDIKADAMHVKIGKWARGQLLLGLCIGALVFLALTILGMPYALTLAVLAAFTEFIPYIGPFIAAIPAVLIAVTQGGFLWAVTVIAVYYVIQWCENNLLVPLIMKRAVGLSPIAIIFAMLVGISFPNIINPVLGILLAVPVTTIIALFLEDWREQRQNSDE